MGMAPSGLALPITGKFADVTEWIQVEYDSDLAWLHTDFVEIAGPVYEIPVLETFGSGAVGTSSTDPPSYILPYGKVRPFTVYRTQ